MKQIVYTVPLEGDPTLETKGFAGAGCQDVSKAFIAALGAKAYETRNTDEMYQNETGTTEYESQG